MRGHSESTLGKGGKVMQRAPLGGRRLRATCLLPSLALIFKSLAISCRPWFQVSEMQSVTLGNGPNVSDLLPNPQIGEIWVMLEL